MLTILFGVDGNSDLNEDIRANIQPYIFEEPIIVEAMKEIEGIYKIEGLAFYSEKWGVLSPCDLSNGMKALLLLACQGMGKGKDIDLITNACLGGNCMKFLCQLSLKYDFNLQWDYPSPPKDNYDCSIKMDDTGEVFTKFIPAVIAATSRG